MTRVISLSPYCGQIDLQQDYNFTIESQRGRCFVHYFSRCGPIGPQNIWEFLYPFALGFFKLLFESVHGRLVGGLGLPVALGVARSSVVKFNLELLQ